MKTKDVLVVPISDLHSGGTTALFPNRFWQFEHTNHTPTSTQVAMFKHFELCAQKVRESRKGKQLILVHDGDAIDGVHHGTLQICTRQEKEQVDIHAELVNHFKKLINFKDGDKVFYTKGTEVHTNDYEEQCANRVGAEKTPSGKHVFDELELMVNGRRIWFVHHGPTAGKGANKGNAQRNWLRDIFYDSISDGVPIPDMIVSGHFHKPFYNIYLQEHKNEYHMLHGMICPPWQTKTRYGYKAAPIQRNKIGIQFFEVTARGDIRKPERYLMKQPSGVIEVSR